MTKRWRLGFVTAVVLATGIAAACLLLVNLPLRPEPGRLPGKNYDDRLDPRPREPVPPRGDRPRLDGAMEGHPGPHR
jgi:hypothetical protein